MNITASCIHHSKRRHQGCVNGRWVIEADADFDHPAGTLVADPAPGEPDDMTFTAKDGKRYWDIPSRTQWTPRA